MSASQRTPQGRASWAEMGCFVAGTLVHTKEGLKPIDQIQVGDLVLSKPDSGQGEMSYQPVTRTFSYEHREIFLLPFTEFHKVNGRIVCSPTEYVGVTGAHPIWVGYLEQFRWGEDPELITPVNAWMSVADFYEKCRHAYWTGPQEQLTHPTAYVRLANGAQAMMGWPDALLQGLADGEGVGFRDAYDWSQEPSGPTCVFGENGLTRKYPSSHLPEIDRSAMDYTGYDTGPESLVARSGGYLPLRRTVYNLEVANNHTYFVGRSGLWVHNTSGDIAKAGGR